MYNEAKAVLKGQIEALEATIERYENAKAQILQRVKQHEYSISNIRMRISEIQAALEQLQTVPAKPFLASIG